LYVAGLLHYSLLDFGNIAELSDGSNHERWRRRLQDRRSAKRATPMDRSDGGPHRSLGRPRRTGRDWLGTIRPYCYRTKIALLATVLISGGLSLLIFGDWVQHQVGWHWLVDWPLADVGSGVFTTGLLGVAWQYVGGRDSEVRDSERLKRVLNESAPAMRDAVIRGFAFEPDDLARVATPAVLDRSRGVRRIFNRLIASLFR
jgi:hypothetical protein